MIVNNLSEINKSVSSDAEAFVNACEVRFDRDVNDVVSRFINDTSVDIVLLAGPSSSGKTTTAGKLRDKFSVSGRKAFVVSLDDFYLDRDVIPVNSDGLKDFENVTALDLDLIHTTFDSLIKNRSAYLPRYDFKLGRRSDESELIKLGNEDILIVEGIHALNPSITDGLDANHLFKIYISVSSRVADDSGEIVLNKRNLRLIRRMVRDNTDRNSDAEATFNQWQGVLKGEDMYLFPFESYADVKINSFHPYESCMLRDDAINLLNTVAQNSSNYNKAQELISALNRFVYLPKKCLPHDSLMREFIKM